MEFLPQTGQHDPGGIVAFPLTQLTLGHFTSCKINNHTKTFKHMKLLYSVATIYKVYSIESSCVFN